METGAGLRVFRGLFLLGEDARHLAERQAMNMNRLGDAICSAFAV